MNMKSYVYTYTVDGALWYVGKGTGARMHGHLRRARMLASGRHPHRIRKWQVALADALLAGATVHVAVLCGGLSESAALAAERVAIATLSPLKNVLPGGEGGRLKINA